MGLIAYVGEFNGVAFWVDGGGLLDPSVKQKKPLTLVHRGRLGMPSHH